MSYISDPSKISSSKLTTSNLYADSSCSISILVKSMIFSDHQLIGEPNFFLSKWLRYLQFNWFETISDDEIFKARVKHAAPTIAGLNFNCR